MRWRRFSAVQCRAIRDGGEICSLVASKVQNIIIVNFSIDNINLQNVPKVYFIDDFSWRYLRALVKCSRPVFYSSVSIP